MRPLTLALRSLARQPGMSLMIVLTLALGIGAGTALFACVMAIVRPRLDAPQAAAAPARRRSARSRAGRGARSFFLEEDPGRRSRGRRPAGARDRHPHGGGSPAAGCADPHPASGSGAHGRRARARPRAGRRLLPALLTLVILSACWLPARRAAHLDPLAVLRE